MKNKLSISIFTLVLLLVLLPTTICADLATISVNINGGTAVTSSNPIPVVTPTSNPENQWTFSSGTWSRTHGFASGIYSALLNELNGFILPPSGKVFAGWDPDPTTATATLSMTFTAQWKDPDPVVEEVDNTPPTTCEYVIGPRWHWNDTLGVCELEGYEVINTSTK